MRTVVVVALVGLAAAALVIWRRGAVAPPADLDLMVIQRLGEVGSDLSKPHAIEFFLYFPTEQAANTAAERIRASGFDTKVELGADSRNWLCLATKNLVPTHEALVDIRAQFEALASGLGGEYDGWGTPSVQ